MNRCLRNASRTHFSIASFALVAMVSLLSLAPAQAQDLNASQTLPNQNEAAAGGRSFPPGTLRGEMTFVNTAQVVLDGKATRLSPGTRIRTAQNMMAMSAALTGQTYAVNYTRDGMGDLREVWILTQQEAKAERDGADRPLFNFWPFASNSVPRDDSKTPYDQLPRYGQ